MDFEFHMWPEYEMFKPNIEYDIPFIKYIWKNFEEKSFRSVFSTVQLIDLEWLQTLMISLNVCCLDSFYVVTFQDQVLLPS